MDRRVLEDRYNEHKRRNRQIDMTRGKPAPDQLDLSDAIIAVVCTVVTETIFTADH